MHCECKIHFVLAPQATTKKVLKLAVMLDKCFANDRSPVERDHVRITKMASKLKGVGQYSKEHMFRTACLVKGKKHPAKKFVIMGSGASKTKYQKFVKSNIRNVADVNKMLKSNIDAGEIAYYLCMGEFFWRKILDDY